VSKTPKIIASKIVTFIGYLLPIYAAYHWYPSSLASIDKPPLPFIVTLVAAVLCIVTGELLSALWVPLGHAEQLTGIQDLEHRLKTIEDSSLSYRAELTSIRECLGRAGAILTDSKSALP
jgi:hypothetical protein